MDLTYVSSYTGHYRSIANKSRSTDSKRRKPKKDQYKMAIQIKKAPERAKISGPACHFTIKWRAS